MHTYLVLGTELSEKSDCQEKLFKSPQAILDRHAKYLRCYSRKVSTDIYRRMHYPYLAGSREHYIDELYSQ